MMNLNNNFLFSEAYIKEFIRNNTKVKDLNLINMFNAIKKHYIFKMIKRKKERKKG